MTYYIRDGESFWPTAESALDIHKVLPVGTYTVGAHPMRGFYLKPISDFCITGKIYGDTPAYAERILSTFASRPTTTGVLLNGEKGSGKTMLAKLVSQMALERKISTLVINSAYHGDAFNTFIQSIEEPCIIVFDEFEKVFDDKEQEAILTLLDGVFPTKKLFMLTVNNKWKVNEHMRNRPGRIYYMIDYSGLDSKFIEEYCNDNLNDKIHIPQICRLTMVFDSFNFDMLKALVEEMNRYNESPNLAMKMLNTKPFDAGRARHHLEVVYQGKPVPTNRVYPSSIQGNPIAQEELEVRIESEDDDDENDYIFLEATPRDLKRIDPENGKFIYVLNEGQENMAILTYTKETFKPLYNAMDALY